MKKTVSLALCIVCALMFSAYDWGKKPKAKKQAPVNTEIAWPATPAEEVVPAKVVPAKVVPAKVVSKPKKIKTAQVSNSADDKAMAISTLAKIVGSGTPDERKARVESLKRVSQALAQNQAQDQAKNAG